MGILEMLKREGIPMEGAEAVVVGRSIIVGKTMAMLLLQQNCTVTICHSRTRNLGEVCRRGDILVVAVGVPGLIQRGDIKPGAVVVDVGMNRISDRDVALRILGPDSPRFQKFEEQGSVLIGDVHPDAPWGVAAAATPVPGGVGPLTIGHLMKNTVLACRMRRANPLRYVRESG
jgi:methylenetetrahydrofolate dehydrogenase (NADP+)/methenyltetrahydrofolate cyclohydrolase